MRSKAKYRNPAGRAEVKESHQTLRFYGDKFIFDTVSGMFYRVSPTASFILRGLQVGTEPGKLADQVQNRYGVTHAVAMRDIELLRNDLAGIEPLEQVRA